MRLNYDFRKKMRRRYEDSFLWHGLLLLFSVAAASFICCVAPDSQTPLPPSPEDQACELNLTPFPYQPQGECINKPREITAWNSVTTSLCCRNALAVFAKALALQVTSDKNADSVFIHKEKWDNCSGPFLRQSSVSIQSCGFQNLYFHSSKCSALSYSSITNDDTFHNASQSCSQFGYSFESDCRTCTAAITRTKKYFLNKFSGLGNDTEEATCGVAIIISIAAQRISDPLYVDDLFRCVSGLNVYDPGYIKLKFSLVKALLALFIATIVLILVIALIKHVIKNKKKDYKHVKAKEIATWSGLYRFSKAEIENAINFGNERKCLGRGSAGTVYKGILPSGQVVAIKHIYKSNNSDTFTREVEGLSRVRHPNLVCLFGCCTEDGEQYLVYEYCSNGNLAQHLLRKDTFLTWERRVKILRDCSLGLRYLHHYIDGCIVHRDIKLTNILLTENLDPKLSDFGLAKMLGMEESKVFTDVRGTIGYMDPEYMSNAKLTCASDIYSFGIVALQLLSGQKVIELDLDARDQLTRKAKDVSMGKRPLSEIKDPRLHGNLNSVDYESILQVAVLCVARSSKGRPTIDVVFDEMDKAWKNTITEKRSKMDLSASATSLSRSLDVMPV